MQPGGVLKIRGGRVEDDEIQGGVNKRKERIAFNDDLGGRGQGVAKQRQGLGELSLTGTEPEGAGSPCDEETRGVGVVGAVVFLGQREGMFVRSAGARLAVQGADAVSVLGDLNSGPRGAWEGAEEVNDQSGLTDIAGVAADEEERHRT